MAPDRVTVREGETALAFGNSLSVQEVSTYLDCPRRYWFQFARRAALPMPRTPWQMKIELVTNALRQIHDDEVTDDLAVSEMVDHLVMDARGRCSESELGFDRSEVVETVLEYSRWAAKKFGAECRGSEWFYLPFRPVPLVDQVDLSWRQGDILVAAIWEAHPFAYDRTLLRAAADHAVLRRVYPESRIEHLVVRLHSGVIAETIPLDHDTFSVQLEEIATAAKLIRRGTDWAPRSGSHCGWCPWCRTCDAAEDLDGWDVA
jgi:hypothetical protein